MKSQLSLVSIVMNRRFWHYIRLRSIIRSYVAAALNHVAASEELELVVSSIKTIAEIIQSEEVSSFFLSSYSTIPTKMRALKNICAVMKEKKPEQYNAKAQAIVLTLIKRNHLKYLNDIIDKLNDRILDNDNKISVTFTSARQLSQAHKDNLLALAQKKLEVDADALRVCFEIDDTIVSGLIIDIGSKRLDLSVRRRLNDLGNLI